MDENHNLGEKLNKDLEQAVGREGKKLADQKINEKLSQLDKKTDEHLGGIQAKLEHGVKKQGMSLLATVYFLLFLEQIPVLGLLLINYFLAILVSLLVALSLVIIGLIYLVAYFVIYKYPNWVKTGSLGFFFAVVLSSCEAFFVVYVSQATGEADLIITVVGVLMIDLICVTLLAKTMKSFNYALAIGIGILLITGIHLLYIFTMEFDWLNTIIIYVLSNLYQIFVVVITEKVLKDKNIKDEEFSTAIFATLLVFKEKINFTAGLGITLTMAIINCCKHKEENGQEAGKGRV